MAFTDNADLFGSVNETGINRLVQHIGVKLARVS